mmetsp:Transcript_62773/g.148660  ORF Transcript_62773/g.148660 Transcript_62773/m.148660 type:complete len:189 (-) Transcript_62773:369-935(-)
MQRLEHLLMGIDRDRAGVASGEADSEPLPAEVGLEQVFNQTLERVLAHYQPPEDTVAAFQETNKIVARERSAHGAEGAASQEEMRAQEGRDWEASGRQLKQVIAHIAQGMKQGMQPPRCVKREQWARDTDQCQRCSSTTFIGGRHHCRICGKMVCTKCASQRSVRFVDGESKEWACLSCATQFAQFVS